MNKNMVSVEYKDEYGNSQYASFDDGVVWLNEGMVRIRDAGRTRALWLPASSVVRISEQRETN